MPPAEKWPDQPFFQHFYQKKEKKNFNTGEKILKMGANDEDLLDQNNNNNNNGDDEGHRVTS